MNGLGSDPSNFADFDSIKRDRKKLFNEEYLSSGPLQVNIFGFMMSVRVRTKCPHTKLWLTSSSSSK
jgi:hypothetical protein